MFRREIADDEGVIELTKTTTRSQIDELLSKKLGKVNLNYTKLNHRSRKSVDVQDNYGTFLILRQGNYPNTNEHYFIEDAPLDFHYRHEQEEAHKYPGYDIEVQRKTDAYKHLMKGIA